MHLYRFVPSYNLFNMFGWLSGEEPSGFEMPSGEVIVDSLGFSVIVLVGWVVALVALTAYLFQKQDITN